MTRRLTRILCTIPKYITAQACVTSNTDCTTRNGVEHAVCFHGDMREVVRGIHGFDSVRRGEQDGARQRKST